MPPELIPFPPAAPPAPRPRAEPEAAREPGPSHLPPVQVCALKAAPGPTERPVPVKKLAALSGYRYNSHFRAAATSLIERGLLVRVSGGVRRPTVPHESSAASQHGAGLGRSPAEAALAAAAAWVQTVAPGAIPVWLRVSLADGRRVRVPFPHATVRDAPARPVAPPPEAETSWRAIDAVILRVAPGPAERPVTLKKLATLAGYANGGHFREAVNRLMDARKLERVRCGVRRAATRRESRAVIDPC